MYRGGRSAFILPNPTVTSLSLPHAFTLLAALDTVGPPFGKPFLLFTSETALCLFFYLPGCSPWAALLAVPPLPDLCISRCPGAQHLDHPSSTATPVPSIYQGCSGFQYNLHGAEDQIWVSFLNSRPAHPTLPRGYLTSSPTRRALKTFLEQRLPHLSN